MAADQRNNLLGPGLLKYLLLLSEYWEEVLTTDEAPAPATVHYWNALCGAQPTWPTCPTHPENDHRWKGAALHSDTCSPPGQTSPPARSERRTKRQVYFPRLQNGKTHMHQQAITKLTRT